MLDVDLPQDMQRICLRDRRNVSTFRYTDTSKLKGALAPYKGLEYVEIAVGLDFLRLHPRLEEYNSNDIGGVEDDDE